MTLLFEFLELKNIEIDEISNVFVNQGSGKFSGIRTSISVIKSICIVNNIDLYGFRTCQFVNQNHEKLLILANNGALKKNLIKPNYSS